MPYALGVDIGGTKIAAGIVDETGKCCFRTQRPSIPWDREKMFRQVVQCISDIVSQSGCPIEEFEGIGIGVPGKVDIEKGIALFQNNLEWTDFPLKERILAEFPIKKAVIDNDVYMAAFAEWVKRGQERETTFVYLTISTGISCCTIHNGAFIRGGARFAGEIGMLPMAKNALTGGCEDRLEAIASGPAIERLAAEKVLSSNKNKHFLSSSVSAVRKNCKEILMAYRNQEPHAMEVMSRVTDSLANGIYAVACILDPDRLVLGGGVINHNPDLIGAVKAALRSYLTSGQEGFIDRICLSILKGDAGVIGAGLRCHAHF
ncbi:glucokinase [Scopulibacillus daqui]|uniref:Glucokinase n=1 Tax=Scopulibacillus daqui TaxID=1469162 RepID=A0ABS2PXW0_9BACL|nr:glucokinase [Scopulibacillus daqui]